MSSTSSVMRAVVKKSPIAYFNANENSNPLPVFFRYQSVYMCSSLARMNLLKKMIRISERYTPATAPANTVSPPDSLFLAIYSFAAFTANSLASRMK